MEVAKCWSMNSDKGYGAFNGVEADNQEILGATATWFYHIQQAVCHVEAYSVPSWLVRVGSMVQQGHYGLAPASLSEVVDNDELHWALQIFLEVYSKSFPWLNMATMQQRFLNQEFPSPR